MRFSVLAALAAVPAALAAVKGFNTGATFTDGSIKGYWDYVNEFNSARNLVGTSGFTSARLYTCIQGGTTNTPTSAFQAAMDTKTSLLIGLWGSAGDAVFGHEVEAFMSAVGQHGAAFTDLIDGISVGSEDLYRITPVSNFTIAGNGAEPSTIANYINIVKGALPNTAAAGKLVGHVDTWTAWVNGSNAEVVAAADFLGMDAYPYYENTKPNNIENAGANFFAAYDATVAAAQGKPVWITETGWPVSGPTENLAVANTQNAQSYWDQVGCAVLGNIPTWWFTLQDTQPISPNPSFGIVAAGNPPPTTPLFSLTC